MGQVFCMKKSREILAAGQNTFLTPIKHPARTLGEHIISYVLHGGWDIKIGETVFHARKDNVFIQPAHILHEGLTLCPPGTSTVFLSFKQEQGDFFCVEEPENTAENSLHIGIFTDASENPHIKNYLRKAVEENTKGNALKAAAFLNLLLCELSESYRSLGDRYAEQIKKIIYRHMDKNLSNEEIAAMLKVSVRTAETSFLKHYGMTIHRYQLAEKIKQACFYLEYSAEMKILDIAQSLGFYDEYHFSRVFKKEMGMSPIAYRKSKFDESSTK